MDIDNVFLLNRSFYVNTKSIYFNITAHRNYLNSLNITSYKKKLQVTLKDL